MSLALVSLTEGGAFFNRKRLVWGSLSIVGVASMSGAIFLETQSQGVTSLLGKLSGILESTPSGGGGNGASAVDGKDTFSGKVNGALASVGGEIAKAATGFWGGVTSFYGFIGSLVKNNGEQAKELFTGLWKFIEGWFNWQVIFKPLMESLHQKLYKFIIFISNSDKRKVLEELFGGGGGKLKPNSTLDAVKMLLGLALVSGSKGKWFEVEGPVFQFLLLKFLDNPERVAKRFKGLVEKIEEVIDRFKKKNENRESESSSSEKTYTLTTNHIEKWLSVEGELAERFFDRAWVLEMLLKLETGFSSGIGKSFIAWSASLWNKGAGLWGKLWPTNSDTRQQR